MSNNIRDGYKSIFVDLGKQIDNASVSAMNRAASSAITAASALIRERYKIRKQDLDLRFKIVRKADKNYPVVTIKITKGDIALYKFNATQMGHAGRPALYTKSGRLKKNPKTGGNGKWGVKAEVEVGKRVVYRSNDGSRGSFVQTMKSGHVGVFIRKSNEKGSGIKEMFGVDITKLIDPKSGNSMVIKEMTDVFYNVYDERLAHELSRV
jgi:hypothetical protein